LEAIFHNDSRVQQWLEQIIEKIFTVCLLKGTESELTLEFNKGRALVVKITLLLSDISSLPPTAVFDAIVQLLEQRLPDQRIIDNFPNFYQVMEDMIREGIAIVAETQNSIEQNYESLDSKDLQKQPLFPNPTSVITLAGGREPITTPRNSGSFMTIQKNSGNSTSSIQNQIADQSKDPKAIENTLKDFQLDILSKVSNEKDSMMLTSPDKELEISIPKLLDIPVLTVEADLAFEKNLQVIPSKVDVNLKEIKKPVLVLKPDNTNFWILDESKIKPIYEESKLETIPRPQDKGLKVDKYNQNLELDSRKTVKTEQISSLNFIENTFSSKSILQTKTKEKLGMLLKSEKELKPTETELQQNSAKNLPLSNNRLRRTSQIPAEATRLALVLQQIFPNTQARWNFNLGEYNFLVQIKDLLIYIETFSEGNSVEKEMKKQGWQVIVCQTEDLSFPRRIERAINRILIKSKHSS